MNLGQQKTFVQELPFLYVGICHFEVKPKINLHCCEDKHDGQIDGNDGLKEERLEVDGDVAHHIE